MTDMVGLVAFGYKYGLRNDLSAPKFEIISLLSMPPDPPSMFLLMHAPSSVPPPPNLKYLLLPVRII